jgi:hypothetical protein
MSKRTASDTASSNGEKKARSSSETKVEAVAPVAIVIFSFSIYFLFATIDVS